MYKKPGFTLIEILVVFAVLALLTLAALISFGGSRDKGDDARVKSDLNRLKIAFEDYYSDHNCYPPLEWFDNADDCGSDQLKPYLNIMPCNRKSGSPYHLTTDATGCTWFKLYGTIKNTSDAKYFTFYEGSTLLGTYAVSSSNLDLYASTASDPAGTFYCSIAAAGPGLPGHCGTIPAGKTCTPSYLGTQCDIDGSGFFCQTAGTCTPL